VGPRCCRGVVFPRPTPNAILSPTLLNPMLALVHAWQYSSQSATWGLDYSEEEAGQAPRGTSVVRP